MFISESEIGNAVLPVHLPNVHSLHENPTAIAANASIEDILEILSAAAALHTNHSHNLKDAVALADPNTRYVEGPGGNWARSMPGGSWSKSTDLPNMDNHVHISTFRK